MSYVRMGPDSDVYVYADMGGLFICCGCGDFKTRTEMIDHLREHVKKGDRVPLHPFKRLLQERRIYGETERKACRFWPMV